MHAVAFGKTLYEIILVLPHALYQIGRNANVEGAVFLACKGIRRVALSLDSGVRQNDGWDYYFPNRGGPCVSVGMRYNPSCAVM